MTALLGIATCKVRWHAGETVLPGKQEETTLRCAADLVKELPATGAIRHIALTVAGFDPSSGAGITADLRVFAAHGVYGVAAITALTVQSTRGVRRVEAVSPRLLRETLDCLAEDLAPDFPRDAAAAEPSQLPAPGRDQPSDQPGDQPETSFLAGVKIGMLGSAAIVREVAAFLRRAGIPRERIVLDPVLRSTSGAALLEPDGLDALRTELLPQVGWGTPNVDELAILAETPGAAQAVLETAARAAIPAQAARLAGHVPGLNIIVTGGHLDPPDDFLLTAAGEPTWFPGRRVHTSSTHGTGCAFSSALLCRLLLGDTPLQAVRAAKEWVTAALGSAVPIGKGNGPVLSDPSL